MKKNGFTLVELIAVLVILSLIALLAIPNIINLMDSSKSKSFVSEVQELVSTATYMYKSESVRSKTFEGANMDIIRMRNINGTIPLTDPYGYTYVLDGSTDPEKKNEYSYFKFSDVAGNDSTGVLGKRKVVVFIKSCSQKTKKCHYICSNNGTSLKVEDVSDNCSLS